MYIGSRTEEIEVTTIEEKTVIALEISETLLKDMLYHAKHPSGYCVPSGKTFEMSKRDIGTFLRDAWDSYIEDRRET